MEPRLYSDNTLEYTGASFGSTFVRVFLLAAAVRQRILSSRAAAAAAAAADSVVFPLFQR